MTTLTIRTFMKTLATTAVSAATLGASGLAHADLRIVGGQSESRFPAVGALLTDSAWFCSGTVIAPRVVLTAAHCLENMAADELELFIGPDANRLESGRRVRVASAHIHPNYPSDDNFDIGVMLLAEDAGVTPIPARLSPLTEAIIGQTATFVGYGLFEQGGDGGEKRSVEIPISELNSYFVGYVSNQRNTCNGDSGGPALMDLGSGLEVVGVTSWGDAGCSEFGYNTRSDVFADWIGDFVAGGVPDSVEVPPAGPPEGDDGFPDGSEGDICEALGWYGDGYCDEDCGRPDPDCTGGSVVDGDDEGGSDDDWLEDGSSDDDSWTDDDTTGDDGWDDEASPGTQPSDDLDLAPGCGAGPGALYPLLAGLGLLFIRGRRRS